MGQGIPWRDQETPDYGVGVAVDLHSEATWISQGRVLLVPQDVHGLPCPSYAGVVAVAAEPATAVASVIVVDATVAAVATVSISLLPDCQPEEEEKGQG